MALVRLSRRKQANKKLPPARVASVVVNAIGAFAQAGVRRCCWIASQTIESAHKNMMLALRVLISLAFRQKRQQENPRDAP
jgi:hypothetical protein